MGNGTSRGIGDGGNGENAQRQIDNYFLIVVGIDQYQNMLDYHSLNNAVRDAGNVARILTTDYKFTNENFTLENDPSVTDLRNADNRYQSELLFPTIIPVFNSGKSIESKVRIVSLFNERATGNRITRCLTDAAKIMGENDALLFYFAGHGDYESSEYYLNVYESERIYLNTSLAISTMAKYFLKSKAKDVLFVLDCCYAGAASYGITTKEGGDISRYVLTSCGASEKANDGPVGEGSYFANAFCQQLEENSAPFKNYDETAFAELQRNFEMLRQVENAQQELLFDALPVKNGDSHFLLEKKEKNKPDLFNLNISLIQELDFRRQKSDLEEHYLSGKNGLNIITTHATSFDVQKVLSKAVLLHINKIDNSVKFDKKICVIHEPIFIDSFPTNGIWSILFDQIKDLVSNNPVDNGLIVDWYLEKMFVDFEEKPKNDRHMIIWIGFKVGGEQMFDEIKLFCQQFSSLFFEKFSLLTPEKRKTIGKMFVVFSDQRDTSGDQHRETFSDMTGTLECNFIPTGSVGNIKETHATAWINHFKATNQSQKSKELTIEKVAKQLNGGGQINCCYEEFVEGVCKYYGYSERERIELHSILYQFEKSLI